MLKNKKTTIKVATLILISLFFFSGISTATSISITETSNEEKTVIEDFVDPEGEENTTPSYETTETDWRPIEESLNFNSFNAINAESLVDPTTTVSYDTITGVESLISSPESSNIPSPSVIEEYNGIMAEAANYDVNDAENNPESVIGTDGRTRITPTTSFPWRTVVKLYMTANDDSTWIASGAMIDEFRVLTAGHCVYIHDHGGWVKDIRVVPAMDDLDDPYGEAWETLLTTSSTWISSEHSGYDWGIITLDRNVGTYTGWMGRMTGPSSSSIYTQTMNVAGYPLVPDSGDNMYWDADAGDGATTRNHFYWADTSGGMSGGPVWRYVSGNRYIMTVHAYGRAGTDSNFGTRLNSGLYSTISSILAGGTSPTDYADLEDRGSSYSAYNLGTVYEGQNFQVWCDVINKGTTSSGSFTVSYYASTNTIISTFDYLLGTDTVSSISPFNYRDSSWTGAFPSIPNDNYYIGWIIDSGGVVTEFDETDNTAYILGYITKEDPPPGGYIELTVKDSDTSLPLSFADVKCYNPSDVLISSGYTDNSGFYNITGLLDIGWYEVNVTKNGYQKQSVYDYINWVGDDDYLTCNLVPYPPDSGWIDVTVKDSDTLSTISSAYVAAHYLNGTFLKGGYTDGSGFYRVTGLGIGWWEIRASKTTYIDQTKNDYINWNGDDDYLTFYLAPYPPNSGWIEVQVNDSITHNPVGNALVETFYDNGTLFDSGFTNTTSGHYIVPDMPIGWFEVNVSKGGYTTQSKMDYINWRGDDDYLWYFMSAASATTGVIEVEVFDSVSSLPMENALVECFYQNGTLFDSGATNVVGIYSVVDLPLGTYTVTVSKLTYYTQSLQDTISAGGEFDHLTFNLVLLPPDSGYIEVQVNDTNTLLPLQNAFVSCFYVNGTLFSTGYTDNSGFFKITGLTVGMWYVEASKVGYELKSIFDFINWIGDDDYLYFLLDTLSALPAHIEVQVNDSLSLNPIKNAFVRCYYSNGTIFDSGYTDSSGYYIVNNLDASLWTITVTYPGYEQQSQDVFLSWWADTDFLNFDLVLTSKPILGQIAIFQDVFAWGRNVTEPILVKNNISYTVYDSRDFGLVDLSPFKKVIISSKQPQTFYDRLGGNVTWFETYANNGGILELHACDSNVGATWYPTYLMPGGLNKTATYTDNVTINMPLHPILLNPYLVEDDELDGWSSSTHGTFSEYPSIANEILIDSNVATIGYLNPVLIEFRYGAGYIIATMLTIEWNEDHNYTRLLENMILYDPSLAFDSIDITNPESTDSYVEYSTIAINWDSIGTISNVKIDLYENGVFVMEIVASTTNDGVFSWNVPLGLSNSSLYTIRISDAIYPLTNDESENFEILDQRSITVVVPDSTTSWTMGDIEAINWTSTGIIANVKIELYAGGYFIMDIAASTSNDGTFDWTIPNTLVNYTSFVIRISDVLDATVYDESEAFSITGVTVPPDGIPGYDLIILCGVLLGISFILVKTKRKKATLL